MIKIRVLPIATIKEEKYYCNKITQEEEEGDNGLKTTTKKREKVHTRFFLTLSFTCKS